jgi:type VI secretion system secreted protein Hcp
MPQFDAFMKIDGIDGESQDSKHSKEIQLLSFSFGAKQATSTHTGSGLGAGKVEMEDLVFTHNVDKASPLLALSCWTGKHITKAVLTARKAGTDQQDYLTVTLNDLLVSSISSDGHLGQAMVEGVLQGESLPTEEVKLSFTQINIEYKEQGADGSLKGSTAAGFNVKTMKKV